MSEIPYQPPQLAKTNGIEICYDSFGSPHDEPMVLIMGLAAQMARCPKDGTLAAAGTKLPLLRP